MWLIMIKIPKFEGSQYFKTFMHSVEKWLNMYTLKISGVYIVNTSIPLKYIWLFFKITHEGVKFDNPRTHLPSSVSPPSILQNSLVMIVFHNTFHFSDLALTYSKSAIKTLEKGVKYVQS